MHNQTRVRLEPFGALYAVVTTQTGQVLGGLCVFELGEMFWREQVGLDLVDVPRLPPRLRNGAFVSHTHGGDFVTARML